MIKKISIQMCFFNIDISLTICLPFIKSQTHVHKIALVFVLCKKKKNNLKKKKKTVGGGGGGDLVFFFKLTFLDSVK